MAELKIFSKIEASNTDTFKLVEDIAKRLFDHLNESKTLEKLVLANGPGNSSSMIQEVFLKLAHELGFKDEAKGLFSKNDNKALRPDYFLKISEFEGILMEVERGKTTINNMDLLDVWKCHICAHANYLFLIVPLELRQNDVMKPRKEFKTVSTRVGSFFVPGNYINVDGLFLFGY